MRLEGRDQTGRPGRVSNVVQRKGHTDRSRTDESVPPDEPLNGWPARPPTFGQLLTPVEAAQYLRLDETGAHTPETAIRTLNYWRDRGHLRATKFARRVWYRLAELDRFLEQKTEE